MKNSLLLLVPMLIISCSESPRFRLLDSKQTGIDFINTVVETDSFHVMSYEYIYNGAGVGIGDLNNDGMQDIVFAGNQVSPRVYLNSGEFRFKDITSNFKGLTNDQWFSGVTIVDINNDRFPDVYFTSTADKDPQKCKNRLWINDGNINGVGPYFTEMAESYGIAYDGQSVNSAFFDYDRDGDLDLYIMNNTVTSRMNTSYRPKITDGSSANNDRLYRNNGDGTFTDVTISAGIVFEGFGLGLAIGDVNKDSYPDIYVSNDYISNDLLYINQGDGTFKNEIRKYMSYQTKSSMGNDMADINNDGNPDMFTLDMMPEYYYKKRQTINGFSYIFYVNDEKYGFEHQYLRNMLHLHNGFMKGEMLPFSEIGQMMGISASEWSWAPLFADYDNDGDKDLIISNGYPKDLTDKDWTYYKARVFGSLADEKHVIEMAPSVKVNNFAFENTGNLSFVKKSDWLPDVPSYSYGSSFVDLDNDGDLDYVVNNLNDEAFILRNYTIERAKKKSGFLRIRLSGKEGNTTAFGAKTDLWSGTLYQFNEHFLTRGYASSVDPVIHFGLGDHAEVDSVKVTWPSGNISVIKNIKANQTIEVNEIDSKPALQTSKIPETNDLLFSKCDSIIEYIHEQTDFIDFFYGQNIIPHKFSQIGPKMAKGDINKDGLEDLIIGSSNKLPTTVFIRKDKEFEKTEFEGLTTIKEFSESDLTVIDFDGDGDNDVIAIAGGYENASDSEYKHYIYENNHGSFIRKNLPCPGFPASVVRPFDFDHDGDIDLFIGSRVKKGIFPFANNSWIILNENGKPRAEAAFSFDIGMVTDAIWTDYDKDGWEDLLIAREWNSLAFLKNIDGTQFLLQAIPEFENYHGIWYSVVAGDFDRDGDDDYIAGNLGDNHRFNVNTTYPMNLYAIDLDLSGNIDPLMTSFWKDQYGKMKEYPVNYLDELVAQSSYFQRRFENYTLYSYANIDDILTEEMLKRLELKLYVNTTSSYIIWNEEGKFRWEKLPEGTQVSPVKKIIVTDFNNDCWPDVLLAGNDYTYDVSTGYYDANKGLVMLNRGDKKSFDILAPPRSGILLQGMVESLILFEGNPSLLVAGMNRAKIGVFQIKQE